MKKYLNQILIGMSAIAVIVFTVVLYRQFKDTVQNKEQRKKAAELIVWASSSFQDSYGPARELKTEFEKTCDCTVIFVDAGGGPMAVEKIKLDPSRRVDVLLGLDLLQLPAVMKNIKLQELDRPNINWAAEVRSLVYSRMIPYDWSPMGFIYRADRTQPAKSWTEMKRIAKKKSISLQDPTLSSPGRMFLFWVFTQIGLDNLKHDLVDTNQYVHSYSPSWSAAYGLFRSKQVDVTFSYLTSLVYHWQNDNDKNFQFMIFDEGHPIQVEYAVVPDSCWNCNVAKNFITFLVSPLAQKILAEKNYMLPVNADIENQLNKNFQALPKVKTISIEKMESFIQNEEAVQSIWRETR